MNQNQQVSTHFRNIGSCDVSQASLSWHNIEKYKLFCLGMALFLVYLYYLKVFLSKVRTGHVLIPTIYSFYYFSNQY